MDEKRGGRDGGRVGSNDVRGNGNAPNETPERRVTTEEGLRKGLGRCLTPYRGVGVSETVLKTEDRIATNGTFGPGRPDDTGTRGPQIRVGVTTITSIDDVCPVNRNRVRTSRRV